MRIFTGQYDRSIDEKNRLQLPMPLRSVIDREKEGDGLYVTLGEHPRTLSLFTPRSFEDLSKRTETEYDADERTQAFELQFFGSACFVDMDKQGRIVVPDRLRKKAKLGEEVYLVGQKNRIDVWNREDLDRSMGIDWSGDDWPNWRGYLRKPPRPSSAG